MRELEEALSDAAKSLESGERIIREGEDPNNVRAYLTNREIVARAALSGEDSP